MRAMLARSAAVGALLLLSAGAARAEVSEVLEFKAPFPFLVNGQSLPAGQYMVEEDLTMGPSILFIHGMHTPRTAIVATRPAGRHGPAEPSLTFERHEAQYQLSAIWESPDEGQVITGRR